ncbi:LLM class flavin-dependent oxidoreductase [Tumebacillus flagellatus]|uniref:Luciferase n=1 Tax=Tumebacillus flagellatus TaxID=1157490 RepID=A0A074MAB3_9BACL|nr:LLM class flavin-dependent oxidoreductase [Tumebacillus flagellatus]KEO82882.1 luciferase [Tumebacillus flagellatus]
MSKQLHEIKLSVLDLSPVTEGSTPAESLRNSLELAQHAEKWGFNRYWLAEHHNMTGIASSATSVVIGYIAGGTKTIRVGSGGIMLPNHAPLVIAEQFGTLESLYPGRIDLGLGRAPGSDQAAMRALRRGLTSNGEDFPELVQELRDYLKPPVEPQRMPVRATPGEGLDIPIYILGSSDYGAMMAALLGLPYAFASHFSPEFTLSALEIYRKNFRPSDMLDKPYAMVGVNVCAADTDEEAEFLATSMQQQFLYLLRGRPGKLQPPIARIEDVASDYELLALKQRIGSSIVGSKETVRKRLQQFLDDTQADEMIVNGQIFDHQKRLRSYEIVSEFIGDR